MDVIINNPPAAQTYAQVQGYGPVPQGYGPYGYGYPHHHGPGFLLPLLIILGAVFFARRRRMMRRHMLGQGGPAPFGHGQGNRQDSGPDFEQMREKFRQGRERFFEDGALRIARERYAKGEINADEYDTLRRNLSGEQQPRGESYRPAPEEQ